MTQPTRPGRSRENVTTVVVALAANLGIALAKLAAAIISGSSAMLAESFHAMADTGNELLLLVAQRKSERPPDENHPLGHGRAAYFWALIAALGVFVTGALLSIRQGVHALLDPGESTSFWVAYMVLAISVVLESVSLWRAYRQLRGEAADLGREFTEHFRLSSDPIARAVLAEDAAAVAGNLIAGAGIGLRQLTGSHVPDGVAALLIGLILGWVALELARTNGDFLIGRRAPANIEADVRRVITSLRGVTRIGELLVTFLGPRQVRVLARVDIDDELGGAAVKSLIGEIEDALLRSSPYVVRVDVVPDGGRRPVS
jgi:cation diffusion facilitator family transporter